MKKTIIALLVGAVVVSTSQAASVLWEVGTLGIRDFTVSEGSVSEKTTPLAGANLYLFLGTTSTSEIDSAFSDSGIDTSVFGATLLDGTQTSSAAGAKAKGTTPITNSDISSSSANDFFLLVVTQKGDDYYYKVVTTTQTGYDTTKDPPDAPTTASFTRDAVQGASWTLANTQTIPDPVDPTPGVPEPATGALALAGVALLFKRRRA